MNDNTASFSGVARNGEVGKSGKVKVTAAKTAIGRGARGWPPSSLTATGAHGAAAAATVCGCDASQRGGRGHHARAAQ